MEGNYPCFLIGIIAFFIGLVIPADKVLKLISKIIYQLFGIKIKVRPEDLTEEEILSVVSEGQEQGVLNANEAEMISNIVELDEKEARNVMKHRVNVVAVDGNSTLQETLKFMLGKNKSRYPVYDEKPDDIIGIIHLRDAFAIHDNNRLLERKVKDIDGLIREAKFVPETRNIHELFKQMQNEKQQMVIVIDEYGQMSGIVTMEDILEEIVGNIMDEYDEEEDAITKVGEEDFLMDGMAQLQEVQEILGIEVEEEFDTLNGLLISKLEHIPEENETAVIEYQGYEFEILSIDNKKIGSVKVKKKIQQDLPME